ncbi:unnamed protein product [Ranitomeya imitator]|uniref:Helix-turn-helix domain-containing protein n=1 Tax=Ranitomeya imitator TaxID=111125 RepID=A0ABN9KTH8_9NEOB|nr:unnamed protein product [Ranitomeya imitator]
MLLLLFPIDCLCEGPAMTSPSCDWSRDRSCDRSHDRDVIERSCTHTIYRKRTPAGGDRLSAGNKRAVGFYLIRYEYFRVKSYAAYWRRYIDDVFLIWTGDVDTLLSFHTYLNSSLPGLTFSLSYDYTSMNFLDTTVIINASRNIETDLFVKSTDRNSLLKYDSCHPHHIKRALPKSQHDRVDRIVSNPDTSRLRHSEMSAKFRSRGYPDHVLKFKQNTLGSDVSLREPRLAFVSTFHPFNSLINKCILQHWDILINAYPQVKEFNVKPIICNKRCSNIRDCLVRADVGPSISGPIQRVLSTPRNGTFPCLGVTNAPT